MSKHYVSGELIDALFKQPQVKADLQENIYPNEYLVLVNKENDSHSALVRATYSGSDLYLVPLLQDKKMKARNVEQHFAIDAVLSDIPIIVLTGVSGSGKTMIALSGAMSLRSQGKYNKVLLTKPMSNVGPHQLGTLPGDISEKFGPYLGNFSTNLSQMLNIQNEDPLQAVSAIGFLTLPLQLIRGLSLTQTLVVADEVQTLGSLEMLTLGTRIGEGSKIILLGDLDQRDDPIARSQTGLYQLSQSEEIKQSPLATCVHLCKAERSKVTELFSQVFKECATDLK